MRRFELHRDEDVSGTSGTGVVAQGVEFDDGVVALHWLSDLDSTTVYASLETCERIHSHGGRTRVVWVDPAPAAPAGPPPTA